MQPNESELEPSFFERPSSKVDLDIGYIVAGLAVVLFFTIFVVGLSSVHSASTRAANGDSSLVDEIPQEIGQSADRPENQDEMISRTRN